MKYDNMAQSEENRSYRELKALLEKELNRNIQYDEIIELGESYVSFYSALASRKEGLNDQE